MNFIYLFFTFILINFLTSNYSSVITSLNSEFIFQVDSINSKNDTINIIAVGDIMMGTNYPNQSYLPLNNGQMLLDGVSNYLNKGDITFANLEGVIGNGGKPKSCNNPKFCYTFRMPRRYVSNIRKSGINLLSIANNHANDFGLGGRKSTARILDSVNLNFAGSLEKPYIIFTKKDIKYGFLSAAPNSGCFNMKNYSKAVEYVTYLDSICDIVIVSFHGGAEGAKAIHTPKTDEICFGNNRGNVYKFAHLCIDAGADLLLGHGPHVTRAVELYKDRFIVYSMGNFCTYARFNLKGPSGVSPIFDLNINLNGEFISAKVVSTKQIGEGIPVTDISKSAWNYIVNLSKEDFPESHLIFNESDCIISKDQ
jgi:poly-gamma-glutamate capsule biosynthesis protein CapA/YwtB (metallophosphatase superfamily)